MADFANNVPPYTQPVLDNNTFTLAWWKFMQRVGQLTAGTITPAQIAELTALANAAYAQSLEAIATANAALVVAEDADGPSLIALAAMGLLDVGQTKIVSPGTHTKITYNAQGAVTAGTQAVLASADYVNQGTVTTVLHGNAAGNPSFGAVSLTADVSGVLPPANGGSGIANAKNLTWSNSLTLAGTDGVTLTFPATNATIARTDTGQTFTGAQVFSGTIKVSGDTTGAGTVAGFGANSPAVTLTAPYTWVKLISSDGSTVWLAAYK